MKIKFFAFSIVLLLLISSLSVAAVTEEPEITLQPQNYQYPEHSVAIYTVKANGSNLRAFWFMSYKGTTYEISNNQNGVEPWEGYAGETYGANQNGNEFSFFFGGIESELNGAEIWCVIEDGHFDVTSAKAIITVQGETMPPEILSIPVSASFQRGREAEIRCVAKSGSEAQLEFQWYETTSGKLQDIIAIDGEDSDYMICDTETVGTRYYVCCVTNTNGGRVYSSVVKVNVSESESIEPDESSEPESEAESAVASESESKPESENGKTNDESENNGDNENEFPLWGYILIGCGCLAIGIIVSLVIIKKKK